MRKVLIVDCDPGCDDAMALLLSIRSGRYDEIIITTAAGNVPVNRTTINAQKIASVAKHNLEKAPKIKIRRGCSVPMTGSAPNVESVHGRDGMGEIPDKIYPADIEKVGVDKRLDAVGFFKSLASRKRKKDEQYDLICIAPLTNLATALSLSDKPADIFASFNKIIIMGGAFKHRGNITPTAEFNFFFDPVAVKVVLDLYKQYCESPGLLKKESKKAEMTIVPLDVTERAQLWWNEIDYEKSKKDPIGLWTMVLLQKYFMFHVFGANALKKKCAYNRCNHKQLATCGFEGAGETSGNWKKIAAERARGNSGNDLLPRFSYLHDPLAVYFALNDEPVELEDAYISIHTGNDEMRGTIIRTEEKASGQYTGGTKVKYMTPEKISTGFIREFKEELFCQCGLVKVSKSHA